MKKQYLFLLLAISGCGTSTNSESQEKEKPISNYSGEYQSNNLVSRVVFCDFKIEPLDIEIDHLELYQDGKEVVIDIGSQTYEGVVNAAGVDVSRESVIDGYKFKHDIKLRNHQSNTFDIVMSMQMEDACKTSWSGRLYKK